MWHREPVNVGPQLKINNHKCSWVGHTLMDEGFNKIAEIEEEWLVAVQQRRFALIVYEYHDGYRYVMKNQLLPLAETLGDAKRMAVPILSLLEDTKDDKPKRK